MRIAILDRHAKHRDQVASALQHHGAETAGREALGDLGRGDKLLVIGVEDDWLSQQTLDDLRAAGQRGVERVLWQLEPLPPTRVSALARRIMAADLDHQAARLAKGRLSPSGGWTLADRITLYPLAASMRRRGGADPSELVSAKMLRYPQRQARCIVSLWRHRLLDRILVSLPSRQTFLDSVGVPSEVVPAGYGPWYGHVLPGVARDIDVVFLGKVSPRRQHLLARFGSELAAKGHELRIIDRGCFGEERTRLLNRTKVLLNFHKFPWEFPLMRLMMAMACGALVVSEQAETPPGFFDERHLVIRPLDGLLDAVVEHLQDDETRQRITAAAYRRVTAELTLERVMGEALLDKRNLSRRNGVPP